MTGMITLSDGGQNYIEFDVVDDVITEVRPALLAGWKGCPVKNIVFSVGGSLKVRLWNDYELTLKYKILKIEQEEIVLPLVEITAGIATDTVSFSLVNSLVNFIEIGIQEGDTVSNETTGALTNVKSVESETELLIDDNIISEGALYRIFRTVET